MYSRSNTYSPWYFAVLPTLTEKERSIHRAGARLRSVTRKREIKRDSLVRASPSEGGGGPDGGRRTSRKKKRKERKKKKRKEKKKAGKRAIARARPQGDGADERAVPRVVARSGIPDVILSKGCVS